MTTTAWINIVNHKHLISLLQRLQENAAPLWGKMTPQQMVEHLAEEVTYTNGKKAATCELTSQEADKSKKRMMDSMVEMPRNLVFATLPTQYVYPNMETAISALIKELEDFESHFAAPGITAVHPAFGPLNYQEWLKWHGKHFTHHFKQFKLF